MDIFKGLIEAAKLGAEMVELGAETLAGRNDGHGNAKPVLGVFEYTDGHTIEVKELGEYKRLKKVPDVKLVTDFYNG